MYRNLCLRHCKALLGPLLFHCLASLGGEPISLTCTSSQQLHNHISSHFFFFVHLLCHKNGANWLWHSFLKFACIVLRGKVFPSLWIDEKLNFSYSLNQEKAITPILKIYISNTGAYALNFCKKLIFYVCVYVCARGHNDGSCVLITRLASLLPTDSQRPLHDLNLDAWSSCIFLCIGFCWDC